MALTAVDISVHKQLEAYYTKQWCIRNVSKRTNLPRKSYSKTKKYILHLRKLHHILYHPSSSLTHHFPSFFTSLKFKAWTILTFRTFHCTVAVKLNYRFVVDIFYFIATVQFSEWFKGLSVICRMHFGCNGF